jgi:hypothetical protein
VRLFPPLTLPPLSPLESRRFSFSQGVVQFESQLGAISAGQLSARRSSIIIRPRPVSRDIFNYGINIQRQRFLVRSLLYAIPTRIRDAPHYKFIKLPAPSLSRKDTARARALLRYW